MPSRQNLSTAKPFTSAPCYPLPLQFHRPHLTCGTLLFHSVTVHIDVEDVNEYAPRFTERSYILDVDEGRLYDEIVQVAAEDEDCSPKYGDICGYEILSSDQPFVINSQGQSG